MSFVKSALTVGANTLLTRILGFAREILIARTLGASDLSDIWVAAFRFPNLFRRVIAEGAFNAAFAPVYGRVCHENGQEAAERFSGNILSLMSLFVFGGVIFFQLCMPYIIYLLAPGYSESFVTWMAGIGDYVTGASATFPAFPELGQDEKLNLTINLTIICLPYAGFMFLNALQSGVLNYHDRFFEAAFSPMILNLVLCGVLLFHPYFRYNPVYAMAWGACGAGFLQVLFLYFALKRRGLNLGFKKIKIDDHIRLFKKLFTPGLISGGVTQINILVGSVIASFSTGAMSYLYYSDRVYQLPLGLIGVTLGVVLLPSLVKAARAGDDNLTRNLYNRSLEFSAFLTLPCSVALLLISEEVTRFIFEHGKFTAGDTKNTANVLAIYGLALPGFILIKLFSPGYYAKEDTKRPMRYAILDLAINAVISITLYPFISFLAVPVAGTIAAWTNVWLLYRGLRQESTLIFDHLILKRMLKILCACAIMGLHAVSVKYFTPDFIMKDLAIILSSMIIYFIAGYLLEILPKSELKNYLRRRKGAS